MTTTPTDSQELTALKTKARDALIQAHRDRSDLTKAQLDEALANLGLAPLLPRRQVAVEVTVTRRTAVAVDDCATQEEAEAKVAAMPGEQITGYLRTAGGYVSHQVLGVAEDPLGWITMADCGEGRSRAREARDAVAAERDAATAAGTGTCRAYGTASYRCARATGHGGQHIATSRQGHVLDVWPAEVV